MASVLPDSSLDQLFRTARTYNGYTDEPVTAEQLHAIWDLMKMGPTSANTLPARLVVAGGAQVVLPDDEAEVIRLMPHIEVRRVAGAGHMIPWDDLEGFLAAVLDFTH